jgi:hypothetical protein
LRKIIYRLSLAQVVGVAAGDDAISPTSPGLQLMTLLARTRRIGPCQGSRRIGVAVADLNARSGTAFAAGAP